MDKEMENSMEYEVCQQQESSTGEKRTIQLSSSNMVQGVLPNKCKTLVLVDSGSTRSLISQSTIDNSAYLANLPTHKIPNVEIEIANGEWMVIKRSITFNISIHGNDFEISGLIVPSLGSLDILWGSKSLQKENALLDFNNNVLKFKCKSILLKVKSDITVLSNQMREIVDKLPVILRNADVLIRSNKLLCTVHLRIFWQGYIKVE